MKRKKICLVTPCLLPVPAVQGGAIETLVTMLIEQNEIEHKVDLIIYSAYEKEAEKLSKQYKYSKFVYIKRGKNKECFIKLYYSILKRVHSLFGKDTSLYEGAPWIIDRNVKILNENADMVVVEGGKFDTFTPLTKKYGIDKMFAHLHHAGKVAEDIGKIYSNVISVSEFVEKLALDQIANSKNINSFVVRNSVEEKIFQKRISSTEREEIRRKFGFEQDDKVLIFCGRLIHEKGVRQLLEAVTEIDDSKIKLLIIGSINFGIKSESPYLQELEKIVQDNPDRVKLTGFIPHEDLYKYYQSADIHVIPSLCDDAAPLVSIEGMLSGLPIITTRSGGLPEYIGENNAVIIDKYNALYDENDARKVTDGLKTAIIDLCNDKDKMKCLAEKSRIQAQKYSVASFYHDFMSIFE